MLQRPPTMRPLLWGEEQIKAYTRQRGSQEEIGGVAQMCDTAGNAESYCELDYGTVKSVELMAVPPGVVT
jgi:acetyl-CoA carboxylase carboxyltransferase component